MPSTTTTTTTAEDIKFITEDLVPELVFDRCFCEPGSREFVELESALAEPLALYLRWSHYAFYRATVVIRFSDVPRSFHVLVKLLPEYPDETSPDYAGFLNEEILWNKASLQYGREDGIFPRFYAADMGRYGRPVIVVEDLEREGYDRVSDRLFDPDEAQLLVSMIARFHAKGIALRTNKFPVFREFYAKLQDTVQIGHAGLLRTIEEKEAALEQYKSCTICQGALSRDNVWFKRNPATGKPEKARLLDWQRLRLAPLVVDLEDLLVQCEQPERFRKLYLETVRDELPGAPSDEELLRDDDGFVNFHR